MVRFEFERLAAEVYLASGLHVEANSCMVGALIDVEELIGLLDTILIVQYAALFRPLDRVGHLFVVVAPLCLLLLLGDYRV